VVNIIAGEVVVSEDPDVILATTLGSCIAACLYDPKARVGGMNHFLLPDSPARDRLSKSMRYGGVAMERLINGLMNQGARRRDLLAKVFGGAAMSAWGPDIGRRNVEFVMEYLANEGIPTLAWDIGGDQARGIRFFPTTGRALARHIAAQEREKVAQAERTFRTRIERDTDAEEGGVELF